jgi:hypothetical protein
LPTCYNATNLKEFCVRTDRSLRREESELKTRLFAMLRVTIETFYTVSKFLISITSCIKLKQYLAVKPFDNRPFSVYILLEEIEIISYSAAGTLFCGFLLAGCI